MRKCIASCCKNYAKENRARCEKHLKIARETNIRQYHKFRRQVMFHYSEGKLECKKCGIKDYRVLQIDHIYNDGQKEKKEINPRMKKGCGTLFFYYWIVKNNFPQRYQILCINCNHIKRMESSGYVSA